NGFADARQAGPERANAPANEVDLDAGLARSIEGLHDGRLQEAIDLGDDASRFAGALIRRFLLDLVEHERLQAAGGDYQLLPLRQLAIAGQIVEEGGGVVAEVGIASEEAEVGVDAGGELVIVSGRKMDVAADAVLFAAHHQSYFAMR